MYIHYMVGAIFTIFILCVHCDNAANDNEIKEILVPSAPRNLIAYNVTSEEVNLAWIPPSTFTRSKLPIISKDVEETTKTEPQGDEPNDVVPTTDTLIPEKPKDLGFSYNLYKNEDIKNYEYSSSILLDPPRSRRDVWSRRHRKRRQDNGTNGVHLEYYEHLEIFNESTFPIEVVKKWTTQTHKETTQMAYVLYYEQGVPRYDANVSGVQTPEDVLKKNIFPSNLGIRDNLKPTMNLTLWNKAGKVTKVVGFRLKNLKPFTPYKIWVRAFYYFPLENVTSSDLLAHLGPESEPLYVLTDVRPPSAPIILNLTCDQPKRTLYLQWRQPLEYNNSIDQYVVTLRKIPEQQPRTRLTLPTNKNDIETTISVEVELWNVTRYEVKIYAVTQSVTRR
ncbi:uncharacterized protein LOC119188557 [Manduca sexta]|uniref:uncharacterized protein LOC119188557 n=1 Tax=Manduca sexta TaxID=7130 RepID=UPI00188E1EFD|nr:uncharacterized protein LOC119188557 [Manduca sexta]